MRYQHYYFCKKNPQILTWLETNRIKYHFRVDFVCFHVYSDQSNSAIQFKEIEKMSGMIGPIITVEFTPKELATAEYLMITPRKQVISIINTPEAYRFSCTRITEAGFEKSYHAEQVSLFAIAKEPSCKTQTAFWSPDNAFDELFTDYRVRNLAEENSMEGIVFKNVLLKNGLVSEKIYQMTTENTISQTQIELGHGEKEYCCPICGKQKFFIDNAYQLHLNLQDLKLQGDLYKTERIFGERLPEPVYIISQKFYRLLKSTKLLSNVTLVPVVDTGKYNNIV